MDGSIFQKWMDSFLDFVKPGTKPGGDQGQTKMMQRERIIVFIGAFVLAIALWFIVNLNGNFNIAVRIPLELGSMPENTAIAEELPGYAEVELTGDGWQLLGLYNDPPTIPINVEDQDINLFDQVRQRLNYLQNVDISKVQPLIITVNLEPKISKKIPIQLARNLSFADRYDLVQEPVISPDSIEISGAESIIEDYDVWVVEDTLSLNNIQSDINLDIPLINTNSLIELSESEITFTADVSEYTEGEAVVYIETTNLPRGQNITYTPSSITIRYDVPIEQYQRLDGRTLFRAYVPYSELEDDSTGFVTPDIELLADRHRIKIRSYQPKAVAYFSVVTQEP